MRLKLNNLKIRMYSQKIINNFQNYITSIINCIYYFSSKLNEITYIKSINLNVNINYISGVATMRLTSRMRLLNQFCAALESN